MQISNKKLTTNKIHSKNRTHNRASSQKLQNQWEGFEGVNDLRDVIDQNTDNISIINLRLPQRTPRRNKHSIQGQKSPSDKQQHSVQHQNNKKPQKYNKIQKKNGQAEIANIVKQVMPQAFHFDDGTTVKISSQKTQYIPRIPKQNRIPIYSQQIQLYPIRGRIVYKGFAAKNSYQLIKNLSRRSTDQGQKPVCLAFNTSNRFKDYEFDSNFQCGNLNIVSRVSENQFDLYMRTDTNTNGHRQWFYFSIKNIQKGAIKLNIFRFKKKYSLFQRGMKPYGRSLKSGNKWNAIGTNVRYVTEDEGQNHDRAVASAWKKTYFLSFTYNFDHAEDTVEFAASLPYTYTFLRQQITYFQNLAPQKIQFKYSSLVTSLSGIEVPLISVFPSRIFKRSDNKQRKYIIINGRTHPGQTSSSWVVDGIISEIVTSVEIADWINQENICFKIVPMLNPDGVFCGNYRTGILGQDFNRNFLSARKIQFPQIYALRNMVANCKKSGKIQLFLDVHGHSVLKNSFMYGPIWQGQNAIKYLPILLSKNCDNFSLDSCRFKSNQNKTETSRLYFQQKQNIFALTSESSLGLMASTKQYSLQQLDSMKKLQTKINSQPIQQASQVHWKTIGRQIVQSISFLMNRAQSSLLNSQLIVLRQQQQKMHQKVQQKLLKKLKKEKYKLQIKIGKKQDVIYKTGYSETGKVQLRQHRSLIQHKNKRNLQTQQKGRNYDRKSQIECSQAKSDSSKGFKIRKVMKDSEKVRIQYKQSSNQRYQFWASQQKRLSVPNQNYQEKYNKNGEQISKSHRNQESEVQQLFPRSKTDKDEQLKRYISLQSSKQQDFPNSSKDEQSQESLNFDISILSINIKKPGEHIQDKHTKQQLEAIYENFEQNYSQSESLNDSDSQSDDLNSNQKRELLKQIYELRRHVQNQKVSQAFISKSPSKDISSSNPFRQYVFSVNHSQINRKNYSGNILPTQKRFSLNHLGNPSQNGIRSDIFINKQSYMYQRSIKRTTLNRPESFHMRINTFQQKEKAAQPSTKKSQIEKFKERFKNSK